MSDPTPTPEVDYSDVDVMRALAIFQGKSNLPEDRYITTWHFARNPAVTIDEDSALVASWLEAFYNAIAPGATKAISAWMSDNAVAVGATAHEVRVYDLNDPEPREPHTYDLGKVTAGTTASLINEAAACLSFYGTRNIPRQRGRVYIGPLTSAAGTPSATEFDVRLAATFQADLAAAAAELINDSASRWVVLSRGLYVDGQQPAAMFPVTAGWVDNAFDIVRKRGVKPSSRVTFT